MSVCTHLTPPFLTPCAIAYDFQTLLTGTAAIAVAILAGIPVWRQLRDINLQTRISHRETLATLLRDAQRRYDEVEQSIAKPLSNASEATRDFDGVALEIDAHTAFQLEQQLRGVLDAYLVVLADTEHVEIEVRKVALKATLDHLVDTLRDAHWADHNDQSDEEYNISDDEWVTVVARCAQAKIEASVRVGEVETAYRKLREAQQRWVQSLRAQIAKLDLQIATPR